MSHKTPRILRQISYLASEPTAVSAEKYCPALIEAFKSSIELPPMFLYYLSSLEPSVFSYLGNGSVASMSVNSTLPVLMSLSLLESLCSSKPFEYCFCRNWIVSFLPSTDRTCVSPSTSSLGDVVANSSVPAVRFCCFLLLLLLYKRLAVRIMTRRAKPSEIARPTAKCGV